jgi:23S rRNA pseudouridine1911/1915/1917 synthase
MTETGQPGSPRTRTFHTTPADSGDRLDVVVTRHLSAFRGLSRTIVRGWIEEGRVRVGGAPVTRPAFKCGPEAAVEVTLPPPPPREPEPAGPEIRLSVLFEDDHLLAIDKPAGVLVHPSLKRRTGTLFDELLRHSESWTGEGRQPGLVSRLDRDTSGVMLVAKGGAAHAALSRSLRGPGAAKEYLAVAYGGTPFSRGRIDLRILRDPENPSRMTASKTEGRASTTLYEKLAERNAPGLPLTLLCCRLLTGRTHQIRVHLSAQGLPLVGDPVYGRPGWRELRDPALAAACRDFPRQALHAHRLAFDHPYTGQRIEIVAPVPEDLAALLTALGLPYPAAAALETSGASFASRDLRSIRDST